VAGQANLVRATDPTQAVHASELLGASWSFTCGITCEPRHGQPGASKRPLHPPSTSAHCQFPPFGRKTQMICSTGQLIDPLRPAGPIELIPGCASSWAARWLCMRSFKTLGILLPLSVMAGCIAPPAASTSCCAGRPLTAWRCLAHQCQRFVSPPPAPGGFSSTRFRMTMAGQDSALREAGGLPRQAEAGPSAWRNAE
jgi:hypothetical protein